MEGQYWLADTWATGMRVWGSDDCLNWKPQDETLPGNYGDVVVSGREATPRRAVHRLEGGTGGGTLVEIPTGGAGARRRHRRGHAARAVTIAAAASPPCRALAAASGRRSQQRSRLCRSEVAAAAWRRIRESAPASRPVVCPLLDVASGSCLVYAERELVLGRHRVESIGRDVPGVVCGNHETLGNRLRALGPAAELPGWRSVLEKE